MYREWASRVVGAVVWERTAPAVATPQRVLPDGCIDLIWTDGELLVAGPDTAAHLAAGSPGAGYTGLRFAPGTGATVIGVPAYELRDRRVPLADLWPAVVLRAGRRITAVPVRDIRAKKRDDSHSNKRTIPWILGEWTQRTGL